MINYKDFKDLSYLDIYEICSYIDNMSDFIPIEKGEDYMVIKKYICKILEIIEKGEKDD